MIPEKNNIERILNNLKEKYEKVYWQIKNSHEWSKINQIEDHLKKDIDFHINSIYKTENEKLTKIYQMFETEKPDYKRSIEIIRGIYGNRN